MITIDNQIGDRDAAAAAAAAFVSIDMNNYFLDEDNPLHQNSRTGPNLDLLTTHLLSLVNAP